MNQVDCTTAEQKRVFLSEYTKSIFSSEIKDQLRTHIPQMNHVDCTTAEQQGVSFFLSEYTKEAEPFHRLSCHTWQLASHTLAVSQLEPDPDKLWEQP
jgi:5'-deoxynucleotidase YfbR-like HD superfamily hydrolase